MARPARSGYSTGGFRATTPHQPAIVRDFDAATPVAQEAAPSNGAAVFSCTGLLSILLTVELESGTDAIPIAAHVQDPGVGFFAAPTNPGSITPGQLVEYNVFGRSIHFRVSGNPVGACTGLRILAYPGRSL